MTDGIERLANGVGVSAGGAEVDADGCNLQISVSSSAQRENGVCT